MDPEDGTSVISLLDEFFEYYEFKRSSKCFREESSEFRSVSSDEWRPLSYFKQKQSILSMLDQGDSGQLFSTLKDIVPEKRLHSANYQRLEFNLHLLMATASDEKPCLSIDKNKRMQEFREFLETQGAELSQTTEFLPYYALPYAPDPKIHPVYQDLYKTSWRESIRSQLAEFLDEVRLPMNSHQPRLVDLVREMDFKKQRELRQLTNELSDAEKRALQAQRRCARIQSDYQTLLSVTADLLDALENSLKGGKISDEVMQKIYQRLMTNQNSSQRVPRKINERQTDNDSLEDSMGDGAQPVCAVRNDVCTGQQEIPLFDLDFGKIKTDISTIDDKKKCYLLQALRWRLTKSSVSQREECVTSFVRNDLLDLTKVGSTQKFLRERSPMLSCLLSNHHRVREYMARFLNALASLCRGRAYLAQNGVVVSLLVGEVTKEKDESITRENLVGALQKMSLRRPMQTIMIKMSTIPWVVELLERMETLSDYTLEYAVALCMNLCLRLSGKRSCIPISPRILKVLVDLLNCENMDIAPYINGALYSILALPEIRKVALSMNLKSVLEKFIKPNREEMNRQFEFIIRRLLSNENPPADNSDDEEDDDDEEDASTLESDLDRQDMPPPEHNPKGRGDARACVGEGLLKQCYAIPTVSKGEANGGVEWCKPLLLRENELRASTTASSQKQFDVFKRPFTPGQRSVRSSFSNSRPNTANKAGLNSEHVPPLTEESSFPLYLRDSLLTLSHGFSADTTPRASFQLDTEPSPVREHSTSPVENTIAENKDSRHHAKATSAVGSKSAFQSRPKIPRTPDDVSLGHPAFPLHDNHSPDSTVTSTTSRFVDADGPVSVLGKQDQNEHSDFGAAPEPVDTSE